MPQRPRPTAPSHDAEWSPQTLIEWLMHKGRCITQADQLTARLSSEMIRLGVPLQRMRISLRTLNPQVVSRTYTWWRDRPQVETYSPPHSIMQSSDYVGSPIEAVQHSHQPFRCRLENRPLAGLHSSLQTLAGNGATDYLALPLKFTYDATASPWILSTDRAGGFSAHDVNSFITLAGYLAPVLEVLSQQMTTRSLLHTYLGPRTAQRVLDGQIKRGDGELIEAAIWYSDMRDSTAITEILNHQQLLHLLNRYFEIISAAVSRHGGEVLRFVGDAMLVVFPTDEHRDLVQACEAALTAAREAHEAVRQANPELQQAGLPAVRYGLGLDVGKVIYGNVGAPDRLDFTVMGSAVNRAARIENLTKVAGCSLLVSEQFASLLKDTFRCLGDFKVAGVEQPLSVYCAKCDDQGC